MSSDLSIKLPKSVSELITPTAFEQFTVSGANHQLKSEIARLTPGDLFESGFRDDDMAACCLSGIWLLHNFLDASHEISQNIHSREGSYWHGIMHRLESDFSNSKYWYRKVGHHPAFESILENKTFDPSDFVDQCESAQNGDDSKQAEVQKIAVAEWKSLFEYCYENAKS